ncbi:MAG TPA: GNAT family N-acetyltransferase [Methylophilaceae bacterium]|nr:GNAT family N-acetyltransferase [Methylophilaceae bacterium]
MADNTSTSRELSPTFRVFDSIAEIAPQDWNSLAGTQPFLQHAFLRALEDTGCATLETGWMPQHMTLWLGTYLVGALPMYVKHHSYGEYVFDWAWADAYERNGLDYYPKLLSAVPFTPVTGPRLLAENDDCRKLLVIAAVNYAKNAGLSSFHCLFPTEAERGIFEDAGLMIREGVQFHWTNPGYRTFNDYLAAMNHDKRKKVRQERRKVFDRRITFRHLTGAKIREQDWEFFTDCYVNTYRQHRSMPYLTLEFFIKLGRVMPDNILLIVAEQDGEDIASSLNIFDNETLYGRYWGAQQYLPGLHFETCYYQAIDFCIARGISVFEGGAQGEHKLARGLLPTPTYSAHWLAHPGFSGAIEEFLARETLHIRDYIDELNEHNPFKSPYTK